MVTMARAREGKRVRGSHRARLLGARITEAVGGARHQAALESRTLLVSALGGEQADADLIDLIGVAGPSVAGSPEKKTEDNDNHFERLGSHVSFDELEARVAELNDEFAELRLRAAEAREKLIGEQVAGGAGVVQVNIGGDLVDVRFDLDALWHLNEQQLGPQLVGAGDNIITVTGGNGGAGGDGDGGTYGHSRDGGRGGTGGHGNTNRITGGPAADVITTSGGTGGDGGQAAVVGGSEGARGADGIGTTSDGSIDGSGGINNCTTDSTIVNC